MSRFLSPTRSLLLLLGVLSARAPAQKVYILYAGADKATASAIERALPKITTAKRANVSLLELADERGRRKAYARFNGACALLVVGERAARFAAQSNYSCPVVTVRCEPDSLHSTAAVLPVRAPDEATSDDLLPRGELLTTSRQGLLQADGVLARSELDVIATAALATALLCPGGDRLVLAVHRDHGQSDLSRRELRRVLRLDQPRWDGGEPVQLLLPNEGSTEMHLLLHRVYQMDAAALRRHWAMMEYRHKALNMPLRLQGAQARVDALETHPGGIAAVPAAAIPRSAPVKILTIDGKRFDHDGYLFQ